MARVPTRGRSPLGGAGYLWRGAQMIRQPGVRRFVVVPLVINTAVFATLVWFAFHWVNQFVGEQIAKLPQWLQWLDWLVWLVLGGALLLFGLSLFTFLAGIVSAPFNALLAEAVDEKITGRKTPGNGLGGIVTGALPALLEEGRKLVYFLKWAIPFALLIWLPGVNIIASPVWLAVSAWLLALQYTDYAMSNNGLSFQEQRRLLRKKRGVVWVFGAAVMVATMIPVVNFLVMPAAVAGATILWRERIALD